MGKTGIGSGFQVLGEGVALDGLFDWDGWSTGV